VAGVIANRAGGPRHVQTLRDALGASGIPLLGTLPVNPDFAVAERHLGLLPPDEGAVEALADAVAEYVDLDAVLRIARTAPPIVVSGSPAFPPMPMAPTVRLAVATDEAFSFYYHDALELLEARGAALIRFSPLRDAELPSCDGLYLGGGRPEAFAAMLGANEAMRSTIRSAVADGLPVYAEGGGFLYLTERIDDGAGHTHPMVGAVPGVTRMPERPAGMSYVTLEGLEDSLLLRTGEILRGHEIHHATVEMERPARYAYRSAEGRGIEPGYDGAMLPAGVAGCAHVHLAALPAMAERFVEACRGSARRGSPGSGESSARRP
jgi:cobyrinic acid a,c-diamide synthase